MLELLVLIGFGLLATHELDAMTQSEWRLLYVLRDLPEQLARDLFVILHVPLFALIAALLWHHDEKIRSRSRSLFAMFLVIHVGLHYRLSDHPLYQFNSALSQLLIFAAGLTGLLYLITYWQVGRR